MLDASSFSDRQKTVIHTYLLTRRTAPKRRARIGIAALMIGLCYAAATTLLGDPIGHGAFPEIMNALLIAGGFWSASALLFWVWLENKIRYDLQRIGLSRQLVHDLLALTPSQLDAPPRN